MLLILADDFTGALDTGVQLAKKGISTRVAVTRSPQILDTDCQVLVVDAETRHCSAPEALDCFRRLASAARGAGVSHIYHKVDSTFRGNVGAQTEGILKGFCAGKAALVPAYPALGRTVRDMHLYLDGVPLERTAFARDPFNPVHTGSIPELLSAQTRLPVYAADRWAQERYGLFVYDAQSEADLRRVAADLAGKSCPVLVGCAGFAEFLELLFPFTRTEPACWPGAKRCLLLSGSVHPQSLHQLEQARQKGAAVFCFTREMKRSADLWALPAAQEMARQARQALQGGFAAISAGDFSGPEEALSPEEAAGRVAGNLAQMAARLLREESDLALAVFGGDTAVALMRVLGVQTLEPLAELCPGVPCSLLQIEGRQLGLVTKAGGFGPPDMISQLIKFLQRGSCPCSHIDQL